MYMALAWLIQNDGHTKSYSLIILDIADVPLQFGLNKKKWTQDNRYVINPLEVVFNSYVQWEVAIPNFRKKTKIYLTEQAIRNWGKSTWRREIVSH